MKNAVALFENYGLVNSKVTYSDVANAFLSQGYTSMAGNTYFNSFRMAEGILIKEDVGEGWYKTFLNGIKIYTIKDRKLVAEKQFSNMGYSKSAVAHYAKQILIDALEKAAAYEGSKLDHSNASSIVNRVVDKAIYNNQLDNFRDENLLLVS